MRAWCLELPVALNGFHAVRSEKFHHFCTSTPGLRDPFQRSTRVAGFSVARVEERDFSEATLVSRKLRKR